MANSFRIVEHTFPGQHVRELLTTLANADEDILYIHAKQYIPLDNPSPQPGDLSIIATHATGFCKEVYEPLWEDLLVHCRSQHVRIRSIWTADIAQQGSSYILNELKLGHAFSWNDHARDILQMVNHFRDQLPQPLIGIGHSMGAGQLVALCSMHPRLFISVAFLDPNIWPQPSSPSSIAKRLKAVSLRKDLYPSRHVADNAIRKSLFFKAWDPRALQIYIAHAFRETPTTAYPESHGEDDKERTPYSKPPHPVTLLTPKAYEALAIVRPNIPAKNRDAETTAVEERCVVPDIDSEAPVKAPFTQPSSRSAFKLLPSLRPRALFIHTEDSLESAAETRELQLSTAGVGVGGSGGRRLGAVKGSFVKGGHLLPFTNPGGVAQELAMWLPEEIGIWKEERRKFESEWDRLSLKEKQGLGEEWIDAVKRWDGTNWDKDEQRELKSKL